jgi:hypothetical protein
MDVILAVFGRHPAPSAGGGSQSSLKINPDAHIIKGERSNQKTSEYREKWKLNIISYAQLLDIMFLMKEKWKTVGVECREELRIPHLLVRGVIMKLVFRFRQGVICFVS